MTEFLIAFESKSQSRARRHAAARAPRRYPAWVARRLALAHSLQRRIERGEFADMAALARGVGFTRARVTQLMDLLLMAPDIQEQILFLEVPPGPQPLSERVLRRALRSLDWNEQRRAWARLVTELNLSLPASSPAPLETRGGGSAGTGE